MDTGTAGVRGSLSADLELKGFGKLPLLVLHSRHGFDGSWNSVWLQLGTQMEIPPFPDVAEYVWSRGIWAL